MTLLVVDASVVVKWFFPQVHDAAAYRIAESDHRFIAPDLVGVEVGNVIWKKLRRGDITPEEGRRLINDFGRLDIATVTHEALLPSAFELAAEAGHPVYDCLYLSLAERSDCRLITADRRFCQAFSNGERGRRLIWIEDF